MNGCRKAAAEFDIEPVIVNTYSDLTHPLRETRNAEREQLVKDIRDAASLRARYVRIVSGQAHPQVSAEDGIAWTLEGFSAAALTAREEGVELVYENHSKPGNWVYPDFSFDPSVYVQIARQLPNDTVKLLFDTANPLVFGVDPLPLLEELVDRVACVHAADTGTYGVLDPVVIGTGIVPFPELLSCLRRSQFEGWVSLEEASGTGNAGLRSGVDYLRDAWES